MDDFQLFHDTPRVQQDIAYVAAAAGSMPAALLYSAPDRKVARWLDVCRCVMAGRLARVADLPRLRDRITSPLLEFDHAAAPPRPGPQGLAHAPIAPQRIAELARGVYGQEGRLPGDTAATLQEEVVCAALQPAPRLREPDLDLTQLLVTTGWQGLEDAGALGRLQLWLHDAPCTVDGSLLRPADDRALVRAPGVALLPVDEAFAHGLALVQKLLLRVVAPSHKFLAWDLRPLARSGRDASARSLPWVSGASATAALAYAALYLLRDHIRDEFAEQRAELRDTDPADISVTAALEWHDEVVDAAFRWPSLVPIKGIDDKLSAFNNLPAGRDKGPCYTATGQPANAAKPDAIPVASLDKLIHRASKDCGSGLSADARALHDLLVRDDQPLGKEHQALIERVASQVSAGGIKGHLVWRYAMRASGRHRPFGAPVSLDRHFVRLQMAPEREDDEPEKGTDHHAPDRLRRPQRPPAEVDDLAKLLAGDDYAHVPAFLLQAGPFAGKTTLLSQYEMRTARAALRRHHAGGPWGEVCVFLPMRGYAAVCKAHRGDAAKALSDFAGSVAPDLPALARVLDHRQPAAGLQVRLLLDALNEISAPDMASRSRIVGAVCEWLAQAQAADERAARKAGGDDEDSVRRHRRLLAPVFSVRERENGLDLASALQPHWRARTVHVLDWSLADMHDYIDARGLPPAARERLVRALGTADAGGRPTGDFGQFCATPGILAGQCTLLGHDPDLALPQRRGLLLLALLWYALRRLCEGEVAAELVPDDIRRELTRLRDKADWLLPEGPEARGLLIDQLAAQADAMQDASGGSAEEVPLDDVPPQLLAPRQRALRAAWLNAVREMGLAITDHRRFAFSHQQFQELFSALGLSEVPGPDLRPLPLVPPDEQALRKHLQPVGARLTIAPDHPQVERVRFALDLCDAADAERRIRQLAQVNLPLAARVAAANRERLEGESAAPQVARQGRPLLQHLRRLLLLRSVDAGADVRSRVLASGVGAALQATADDTDAGLNRAWQAAWDAAFRGEGVDLRLRIEAGLLLGELGDTLRYERVAGHGGLRLRAAHWIGIGDDVHAAMLSGEPARTLEFEIGDASRGGSDEKPPVRVRLPGFAMAAYAVTVAEWRAFMAAGGYEDAEARWWQAAGAAAQAWLRERQAAARQSGQKLQPRTLEDPRFNNPAQPVTGITWFEAMAYAAWAAPMVETAGNPWRLCVPTEIAWEAAVRGEWQRGGKGRSWPHPQGDEEPDALCFNHAATRWGRPTPVGVFSRGYTASGIADAAGNTWDWCANAYDKTYRSERGIAAGGPIPDAADAETPRALRGGGCHNTAGGCRAGYRDRYHPALVDDLSGVRLVRMRLPHSEH